MTDKLSAQHCEPCQIGSRPLPPEDVNQLMTKIPRWKQISADGEQRIQREFHFQDFKQAFSFAYKVASMAEREDHHPSINIEWGMTRVTWWTHKVNGLHMNDFIMAAKTDVVFNSLTDNS